jgi:hypothetical protein
MVDQPSRRLARSGAGLFAVGLVTRLWLVAVAAALKRRAGALHRVLDARELGAGEVAQLGRQIEQQFHPGECGDRRLPLTGRGLARRGTASSSRRPVEARPSELMPRAVRNTAEAGRARDRPMVSGARPLARSGDGGRAPAMMARSR